MDDEKYMKIALETAKKAYDMGEIPIGAVVVYEDEIIAKAHNYVEHGACALNHAEILAIREASKKLGWRLEGATLYVTLEPCVMCTGALIHSRIDRVVYALSDPKRGCCGSIENFLEDPRFNHHPEITKGVLEKEAKDLIQDFFRKIRSREIPKIPYKRGLD